MAYFQVGCDYETSEHAGARDMYQIDTLLDENDNNVTDKIDVGKFFHTDDEKSLINYLRRIFTVPDDEEISIDYL